MIDIHTHLLPGVDDGSPNLNTSINLIKDLVNQGVTDIILTPHFYRLKGYYNSYNKNKDIFERLEKNVKDNNIDVKLYLGNEIYYNQNTLKLLREGTVSTLNESKYVLIEFSFVKEKESIVQAVNNLTASDYIPIIAHPERYPYLKTVDEYKFLKRMGAMFQVNASSLMGNYGRKIKKFVHKLIEEDLVNFVSSDIHDFRRAKLREAYDHVKKHFSERKAEELFNNFVILN